MLPSPSTGTRLTSTVPRAYADAHGAVAESPMLPARQTETRLGPWILEATLVKGLRASVFRARPAEQLDRGIPGRYALKLLNSNWQEDYTAISRMRSEATIGQCVSNRHIVSVVSSHLHEPPFYLLMPLFDGTNVARLISKDRPLETPLALWIARQTAEALDALHTLGYMHGDVKPANLLMAKDGHILLIDLGCARRLEGEPTLEDPPLLGTPNYLAPECFSGSAGDSRSDIYSLGICLFELLTGRLPISATEIATVAAFKRQGAMPNVRIFRPSLSNEVAELVRELTARDPLRRPQQARDVVQQLIRLEIATLRQRISA
jgi:eukaryotic-like serine/threonine-protein kinase